MLMLVRWTWPKGIIAATVTDGDSAYTHAIQDADLTAFAVANGKTTWDETDIEPYLATVERG